MSLHNREDTLSTYQQEDSTIDLWSDVKERKIILRDQTTHREYAFRLKSSFVIGRDGKRANMKVTASDMYMSARHVHFMNQKDGVYIEDMNSRNGTYVNGKKISMKARLNSGDQLRIGRTDFLVYF